MKLICLLLLLAVNLLNCNAYKRHNRPSFLNRPIVGGVDAHITNFPYQVSLGKISENKDNGKIVGYRHFCGGSIISVEWVLTAAHCIYYDPEDFETVARIRVRVGSHIKTEGGTLHKVARLVYHPGFDFENLNQDVGVIKVKEPFEFGPTVQPITLTRYPRVPGGIVTVSGWGTTTMYGDSPERLQRVQIPILPQWECELFYRMRNITEYMFCAGRAGRSACHGDSGGPVVYNGIQVGLVSWGFSCQRPDYPVVYTNVIKLRDWIHKYTGV